MKIESFIGYLFKKQICIIILLLPSAINAMAQADFLTARPWKILQTETKYENESYEVMPREDMDPCLQGGVYHFLPTSKLFVKLNKIKCDGITEMKGTWKVTGSGSAAKLILAVQDEKGVSQETVFQIEKINHEKMMLIQSYKDAIGVVSERTTYIPAAQKSVTAISKPAQASNHIIALQSKTPSIHKAVFASELYEFIKFLTPANCKEKLKQWGYSFSQIYSQNEWIFNKGKEGYLILGQNLSNKKFEWITYKPNSEVKLPAKHFNEFKDNDAMYIIEENAAKPGDDMIRYNSFYYSGYLFRAAWSDNECGEFSVHKMASEWHYKKLKENYPAESFPELKGQFDVLQNKSNPTSPTLQPKNQSAGNTNQKHETDSEFCSQLTAILQLVKERKASGLTKKKSEDLNYNTTYMVKFPLEGFEKIYLYYYLVKFTVSADLTGSSVTNETDEPEKEKRFQLLVSRLDNCIGGDFNKFVTKDKKTIIYKSRLDDNFLISCERDPIDSLNENIRLKITSPE